MFSDVRVRHLYNVQDMTLQSENAKLREKNKTLQSANDTLQSANDTLQSANDTLQSKNTASRFLGDRAIFCFILNDCRYMIGGLQSENDKLRQKNKTLQSEIARLEHERKVFCFILAASALIASVIFAVVAAAGVQV